VTGVLFGLAPALTLSGAAPGLLIRRGGQTVRGRGRLQRVMIATELALSMVLLVGAGLLSRSLAKVTAVDPGFRPDHLLSVRLSFPRGTLRDDAALRADREELRPAPFSAVPISGVRVGAGHRSRFHEHLRLEDIEGLRAVEDPLLHAFQNLHESCRAVRGCQPHCRSKDSRTAVRTLGCDELARGLR